MDFISIAIIIAGVIVLVFLIYFGFSFSGIYKTLSSVRYLFYGDFNTGARNAYGVDFVDFIDALLCDSTQTMFEKITKRLKDNQFPYDNNPACPQ